MKCTVWVFVADVDYECEACDQDHEEYQHGSRSKQELHDLYSSADSLIAEWEKQSAESAQVEWDTTATSKYSCTEHAS